LQRRLFVRRNAHRPMNRFVPGWPAMQWLPFRGSIQFFYTSRAPAIFSRIATGADSGVTIAA
jgi:hypothetical protein